MKYYNLLILLIIALKCGADEEPTTVNYSAVENVPNSEVFSASTAEGKLTNISSSSEPNGSENTLINATDDNAEFDLPIPGRAAQQGTRMVKNIIGSLMKGFTQLNEPDSKEDAGDMEEPLEPTTDFFSTVENVSNSEVSNTSTTEAPDNFFEKWTQLPNVIKGTPINATIAYAINPFNNKEFGKLPLPRKLPRRRTRLVTNIIGSLMKGLAQLKEPDSEEDVEGDDEEPTTENCSSVENVTNSEASNASTTEAPENLFEKLTQLPNIIKSTIINATAINPFKNKEFGKLPLPRKLPGHRTRLVTNIIGSLMKGLAQLKQPDSEEHYDEITTVNYSTVENVTNSEVFNASTTEAPDNSASEPPGAVNTLINATNVNAVSPFRKKEFGKLSLPRKLPGQRTRLVTNIIGSLMKGLAQLKEPDSEEDNEELTTVTYSTIENVTNCEVSNASTSEAPDNRVDKTPLSNINVGSSSQSPATENTLIKATDGNAVGPSKNKVFGKLIPGTLPQQGTRVVTKIIGSLLKGLP